MLLMVALIGLMLMPALARDEAKPEPRKLSKTEQRKLDKERNQRRKERKAALKKDKKANKALAEKLETLMDGWDAKGFDGAVLVAKHGEVIFKGGYGMADREAKRANATDTLYDIGSVTKLFTAAGVLRLEQDGKLKLDDTIGKHITFAPEDKKGITIKQLLSHTSGLAREYDPQHLDAFNRDITVKGLLSIPLKSEPGTAHEYSNANYYIAAAIIEFVTNSKYEDYMMKHVIEATDMKDSAFCSDEKLDDKRSAMRYQDGKKTGNVTDWPFTWGQRGCGYLVSTVEDMWKFSEAIDFGDFIDEEAKKSWFEVQKDNYALGWYVQERNGRKVQWHGGASSGAWAHFARYPDDDVMFVFLINIAEQGKRIDIDLAEDIETTIFGE
jgi:CubicO group peptidase (beta-lactamase class C family)